MPTTDLSTLHNFQLSDPPTVISQLLLDDQPPLVTVTSFNEETVLKMEKQSKQDKNKAICLDPSYSTTSCVPQPSSNENDAFWSSAWKISHFEILIEAMDEANFNSKFLEMFVI